jgi:hypothetical protein
MSWTNRILRIFEFFAVVLLGSAVFAGTVPADCGVWPAKPAWEWSDEERLGLRFDELCVAARRAVASRDDRPEGACRASGAINDFVFGTDTPELFLPWQLYDTLLGTYLAEPKFAEIRRELFADRARAAGVDLPPDFWRRVEMASGDYLSSLRAQNEVRSKVNIASPAEQRALITEIESSQRSNCVNRASALARVRAEFPANTFDKLLYIAVAPGLCSSGNSDRNIFRWVGRGCPR